MCNVPRVVCIVSGWASVQYTHRKTVFSVVGQKAGVGVALCLGLGSPCWRWCSPRPRRAACSSATCFTIWWWPASCGRRNQSPKETLPTARVFQAHKRKDWSKIKFVWSTNRKQMLALLLQGRTKWGQWGGGTMKQRSVCWEARGQDKGTSAS